MKIKVMDSERRFREQMLAGLLQKLRPGRVHGTVEHAGAVAEVNVSVERTADEGNSNVCVLDLRFVSDALAHEVVVDWERGTGATSLRIVAVGEWEEQLLIEALQMAIEKIAAARDRANRLGR